VEGGGGGQHQGERKQAAEREADEHVDPRRDQVAAFLHRSGGKKKTCTGESGGEQRHGEEPIDAPVFAVRRPETSTSAVWPNMFSRTVNFARHSAAHRTNATTGTHSR
jgi:hypothetical protein